MTTATEGTVTINVRKAKNATVLDLDGSLIIGKPVETFRDQIRELVNAGTKNLVVNLAGVSHLDSSGIGALVGALTSIEVAGASCKSIAASKRVIQILKTARLDEVLDLHKDEASALSSF